MTMNPAGQSLATPQYMDRAPMQLHGHDLITDDDHHVRCLFCGKVRVDVDSFCGVACDMGVADTK